MLADLPVDELATELYRARAEVHTVRQLSLRYPDMTIRDAYAVQRAGVRLCLGEDRRIVGRKVGLTSIPMQRAMGIDEPDYGVVFDDMVFGDGSDVPAGRFNYPRVEIELAFVLRESLYGPEVGPDDVLRCTAHLAPSIEILDSRIEMVDAATGHRRTIVDTVADNAADAGMIVGPGRLYPSRFRPREVGAELIINDVIVDTGLATAVLGNPIRAVAWLANTLAGYGEGIEAGQTVLSGSFIQSVPVGPGDHVVGDFGGLGTVSCRFV